MLMAINATRYKTSLKNQRGITLTELSVSVAIVSLMIAGTFGGITMLKAAKIRKIATEFTTNMSAIGEFQTQFGFLPGDLPNASSYWSGAHNGDGNGLVEGIVGTTGSATVLEDLYVWEHLAKAKLIAGTYSGAVSGTRYAAPVNAPNSEPFTTGVFSFYAYQALMYNTSGQALRLGSIATGLPTGGFMLAKDAYSIDVKLDDGLASSGMFYTTRDTSGCTSADGTTASANYVMSDADNATCQLFYWQKKF
jgi:hypothetical protein